MLHPRAEPNPNNLERIVMFLIKRLNCLFKKSINFWHPKWKLQLIKLKILGKCIWYRWFSAYSFNVLRIWERRTVFGSAGSQGFMEERVPSLALHASIFVYISHSNVESLYPRPKIRFCISKGRVRLICYLVYYFRLSVFMCIWWCIDHIGIAIEELLLWWLFLT